MEKLIIQVGDMYGTPQLTYLTEFTETCSSWVYNRQDGKMWTEDEFKTFVSYQYESQKKSYHFCDMSELEILENKVFGNDWDNEREYMRAEAQNRELTEDEHIIYNL